VHLQIYNFPVHRLKERGNADEMLPQIKLTAQIIVKPHRNSCCL
jgi:hypothetical protein